MATSWGVWGSTKGALSPKLVFQSTEARSSFLGKKLTSDQLRRHNTTLARYRVEEEGVFLRQVKVEREDITSCKGEGLV